VVTTAQEKNGSSDNGKQKKLQNFVQSLSGSLMDITAVEVNTMVVEEITANKFIPWQVYRDVYPISRLYLEKINIHPTLRDRYLNLRRQLEIEYSSILTGKDPTTLQDSRILTDPTATIDDIQTKLPNPLNPGSSSQEVGKINELLENGRFLRQLRKIGEIKAALDKRNQILNAANGSLSDNSQAANTDLIYAQTITQLDGKIFNRFHQQLFDRQDKDLIVQIHKEAVSMGNTQWQGLMQFALRLMQSMLGKNETKPTSSDRN
jgi:hypothetical protein